jgi:hypothetical protein
MEVLLRGSIELMALPVLIVTTSVLALGFALHSTPFLVKVQATMGTL